MGQRKQSDLLRYIAQLVSETPAPTTMGALMGHRDESGRDLAGLRAIVDAGGPQTPVVSGARPPSMSAGPRKPTLQPEGGEILGRAKTILDLLNATPLGLLGDVSAPLENMDAAGPVAGVKKGIRAFHASPHDFDQFSLSKIGTGEGAQAYGHGLYFAESPKTAKAYWDQFEGRNFSDPEKVAIAAAKELEPLSDGSILFGGRMWPPDKWVEAFKTGELTGHKLPPGVRDRVEKALLPKTYEVSINADPEDFLDWDAPLSQQPKIIGKLGAGDKSRRYMELQDALDQMQKAGKLDTPEWNAAVAESRQLRESAGGIAPTMTGEEVHRSMWADADAPVNRGRQSSIATERLKAHGIPGIKYLDGASRSAGQGSRNYVVFDDKLISIVKKYGVAGALTAGLINQAQAQQLQQEGYE